MLLGDNQTHALHQIALATEELSQNSTVPLAGFLARLFQRQGQWHKAATYWKRVLEAHPEDIPGRLGMGQCLESQGDLPGAERLYKEVLEQYPNMIEAVKGLFRLAQRTRNEALLKGMGAQLQWLYPQQILNISLPLPSQE